jgi:hypothetical protein
MMFQNSATYLQKHFQAQIILGIVNSPTADAKIWGSRAIAYMIKSTTAA